MSKTFIVNVAGHLIVEADEEEDAIDMVKQKLADTSRNLGAGSGFRVESATEIVALKKSKARPRSLGDPSMSDDEAVIQEREVEAEPDVRENEGGEEELEEETEEESEERESERIEEREDDKAVKPALGRARSKPKTKPRAKSRRGASRT